ncbi:YIEGIA family protein [Fodinisporobacter ferrooxydans]|uniref:YIEGIA family protein n=1 Tax=Fodinisporobacter ferrooxydans TaxID=2901836 RepID=A0ABY4CN64_9BACL|nr:YIEGIA family protein [Alicyclobacillaceae bacterium MYW30-H2]
MKALVLTTPHIYLIVIAIIGGTLARIATLREDYRQYPSFPNGYLNQAVFGFVASTLGAVAIPALMANNFTAVTFLTLALTQFQNVRKLELNSLQLLEETEYTKRGNAYIDGIAKTFEARNYISLLVAIAIGICMEVLEHKSILLRILVSIIAGLAVFFGLTRFSRGKRIGDIAEVRQGEILIKNGELYVDTIFVSNRIGIERGQEMILNEGMAVVVYPKSQHYRIALDNFGQRQAILFEITRSLGVKRYHYTRKNYEDGRIVFFVVPILHDIETMIQVVRHTPVLESIKKTHLFLRKWEEEHVRH